MVTLVEKLREKDDFVELGGVSEDTITQAENKLGLKFSKEYHEYLVECGAARAEGHEFTGISKSQRLSVVFVTIQEKKKNPYISNELYVIEDLGIDGIIIWQAESSDVYQTVANGKPEKIAKSMLDYFIGN